jgi:aquaporin rerated protein, other eukaryote
MIGAITWARAGLVFIAEMIAGMCAAGVVAALFPGPMAVSTTLSSTTSVARGLCKFGRNETDLKKWSY